MVDILIIGAGPAGCATAISGARAGWRVSLIERAAAARDKPGETLHPGIEPLLQQLGVAAAVNAAGFRRHPGYWRQRHTEPAAFEAYGHDASGPWLGYQAERRVLDALLLEQARAVGVAVLQPCQALTAVRAADGRVTGVQTSFGLFPARVVVDASGQQQWLARQLNLPVMHHSPPLRVHYGYLHQAQCKEAIPKFQICPTGWRWTAPISDSRLAWVILNSQLTTARPSLASCLGSDFDLTDAAPVGLAVRTQDVTWRSVDRVAGPGYILTGDAAALLDPAAGRGVLKAIMSGIMAAQIAEIMIRNSGSGHTEQRYQTWLSAWFQHDIKYLRHLYIQTGLFTDVSRTTKSGLG